VSSGNGSSGQRVEESHEFGFDTRQLHAGQRPDPNTGARAVPIFQTTSYVFEDPESAAAYFNLQEYGNTYSRIMNPTVAVFEERVANLEGGSGAVAFSSGIAAQAAALFTLLQPGDHVVSSSALYGGTVNQFKHLLRKMNVGLTWVDPDDADAWRAAVQPTTKAFYGETARERHSARTALEVRHSLLEHRGGGVHDPRVGVAVLLQVEVRSSRLRVLEDVAGGLEDRHRPGAGVGVRTLTRVQLAGVEPELVCLLDPVTIRKCHDPVTPSPRKRRMIGVCRASSSRKQS